MKRSCFFGFLALGALFFKLPEAPSLFDCKICQAGSPYLPIIGSGYFSFLIVLTLLFKISSNLKRGGIVFSLLLAAVLSYLSKPFFCLQCLIAHICHILFWLTLSTKKESAATAFRERLCIILFAPFATMTLFASLNLTFLVYGFQIKKGSLKAGDTVPFVNAIINFVAPNCPYCKEQMPLVDSALQKSGYKLITVTPSISNELKDLAPHTQWLEDSNGLLREQFKVRGYPTLFIVGEEGKVVNVIAGVPDKLQELIPSKNVIEKNTPLE